jgi:monofunctional glycosyltransferase
MRRRLLGIALGLLALSLGYGVWVWAGLPPRSEVRALARRNPGKTRLMLQREEEARGKGRRLRAEQTWVPLSQVSRHLIHAVLASEDQKFFGHEGVDWEAVEQSIGKDIEKGRFARGGSTITQQLAKNLYFGTRKSLTRKARELVVTWWLERDLSKVRILTLYLNLIEWGDGIYGCEAASQHWYGVPAAALDANQAASLAAMIPNPRRLNPRVSPARLERATRRVLWLMAQAGYLGRDVAGLGAEPPPEPVEEDEEPAPEPTPELTLAPTLEPAPGLGSPATGTLEEPPAETPSPASPPPLPPAPSPSPSPAPTAAPVSSDSPRDGTAVPLGP